jgi:hypothetical protein
MGNRKRSYVPQNPSPDSSGKPMPVETTFFSGGGRVTNKLLPVTRKKGLKQITAA